MPRKIKKRGAYGGGSAVEVRPGVWRIRVSNEGVQICRTLKGTEAQAVRFKTTLLNEVNSGSYVVASPLSFSEYLEEWLENVAKAKAPNTYTSYRSIANNHLFPCLGHLQMQKIKPSDLKAYFADLPPLAPSTRSLHYVVIHSCLDAAVKEGLLKDNPASRMAGKPRPERGSEQTEAMKHCWNETDTRKFLVTAQGFGPRQAAFYSLALDTGMRRGELCALKWASVDWQKGTVRVSASVNKIGKDLVYGPTKGRQARTLVISQECLDALKRLSLWQLASKDGFVFTTPAGLALSPDAVAQTEYEKIKKLAKVKPIKFHGLRHTCATLLLTAGVPVHYVSERLGHKDITITLRIYAHCTPSGEKMLIDKLREALGYVAEAKAPSEGWKN